MKCPSSREARYWKIKRKRLDCKVGIKVGSENVRNKGRRDTQGSQSMNNHGVLILRWMAYTEFLQHISFEETRQNFLTELVES